jgi:hypothetical protein
MNANSSRRVAVCSLVLVALGVPSPAQGGVLCTAIDNLNGTFTYAYTVDNTGGAFPVMAWSLEFSFGTADRDWDPLDLAGGGDVVVPGNWIADNGKPVAGLLAQDFLSLDTSSDVAPGASLGGFSFVSARQIGSVQVYTFGPAGESASGTTRVIPEPVGTATLMALLGGAYGVWRRSRRDTP